MQDILKVNNLYVIYNKKQDNPFVAVKNFSYKFQTGKIYCIVGQSGSGKSSLINCFNGLNTPDYGQIDINGIILSSKKRLDVVLKEIKVTESRKDDNQAIYDNNFILTVAEDAKYLDVLLAIKAFTKSDFYLKKEDAHHYFLNTNLTIDDFKLEIDASKVINCVINPKAKRKIKNYKEIRKSVGIVYQFPEFQLFKPTVISDVSFGLINMKIKKEQAIDIAKKTLTQLGIKEQLFENSPFCLSGGQKRKVALAGIFSINPNIYVFDEPTAGLDPVSNNEMMNYMLDFKNQNKCVIVVTHSMDDVLYIADEILVIHNGRMVKAGEPYEIFLDKDILKNSRIELPLVIKLIINLVNKNNKYAKLLALKPRTVEQLADCIETVIKGEINV